MNYWKNNGAPAEKLIVGFPAYGHNFILRDASNNGIGAPISGAGPAGTYTREAGFWDGVMGGPYPCGSLHYFCGYTLAT